MITLVPRYPESSVALSLHYFTITKAVDALPFLESVTELLKRVV